MSAPVANTLGFSNHTAWIAVGVSLCSSWRPLCVVFVTEPRTFKPWRHTTLACAHVSWWQIAAIRHPAMNDKARVAHAERWRQGWAIASDQWASSERARAAGEAKWGVFVLFSPPLSFKGQRQVKYNHIWIQWCGSTIHIEIAESTSLCLLIKSTFVTSMDH